MSLEFRAREADLHFSPSGMRKADGQSLGVPPAVESQETCSRRRKWGGALPAVTPSCQGPRRRREPHGPWFVPDSQSGASPDPATPRFSHTCLPFFISQVQCPPHLPTHTGSRHIHCPCSPSPSPLHALPAQSSPARASCGAALVSLSLCRFGQSPAARLQKEPHVSDRLPPPPSRQGVFSEDPTTDPGQALGTCCASTTSTRLHRLRERGCVRFPRRREDLPEPSCWCVLDLNPVSDFQAQFQNLWLSLQSPGA